MGGGQFILAFYKMLIWTRLAVPETIAGPLRHLREEFMEGAVDREHTHCVVLSNGQDDEAVIQPDAIPLQPQDFASSHAGCQGAHDNIPERMREVRTGG